MSGSNDSTRITMFAFDSIATKRFNRFFIEDFRRQPNCDDSLWNELKDKCDKVSFNYKVKKNTMQFQIGKIEQPMTDGFVVIWGYKLNDTDVNDKEFLRYISQLCKKGIPIVNKPRQQEERKPQAGVQGTGMMTGGRAEIENKEEEIKTMEEYGWKFTPETSNDIRKVYTMWDAGGEYFDTAEFNLQTNTIDVSVVTNSYLLPEYKRAIERKAKDLGMTNITWK